MNADEIRKLPDKELDNKVKEIRERLWNLRFKATTEEGKNPAEAGQLRRDIARINTVLGERARAAGGAKKARLTRDERRVNTARALRMRAEAARKAAVAAKPKAAAKKKAKSSTGASSGATAKKA